MQTLRLLRNALVVLPLLGLAALPACCKGRGSDVTAATIATDEGVSEQSDAGTVSWAVSPDGQVKALIKATGSDAVDPTATGTVTARTLPGGAPVSAPLVYDAKAGLFTAKIAPLGGELTEVKYEVKVGGKATQSVLHLPKGGTTELIASARAASGKSVKSGKGPNGGVVQVVGGEVIEIVGEPKSGETRVYILSDDLKPVAVGKRQVKLAVVAGPGADFVELHADPTGMYFSGKLAVKVNPIKLTVVLREEGDSAPVVVLCGWAPGAVIVVGNRAPTLAIFVVTTWAPVVVVAPTNPVIVVHEGKGKGKGRGHGKGHK